MKSPHCLVIPCECKHKTLLPTSYIISEATSRHTSQHLYWVLNSKTLMWFLNCQQFSPFLPSWSTVLGTEKYIMQLYCDVGPNTFEMKHKDFLFTSAVLFSSEQWPKCLISINGSATSLFLFSNDSSTQQKWFGFCYYFEEQMKVNLKRTSTATCLWLDGEKDNS